MNLPSGYGRSCVCAALQLTNEFPRVLNGVAIEIIVEICPHPLRVMLADSFCPYGQLFSRIIMAIPAVGAMKPNIDFIACLDELVRQARAHCMSRRSC